MFDASLPSPKDLTRRALLRQLRPQAPKPPPPAFRVRAWRWHHLGVKRDLTRLERNLTRHTKTLCPSTGASVATHGRTAREAVLDALQYIIDDNWRLHNHVETSLFVPWLRAGTTHHAFTRHAQLVQDERTRLEVEADAVLDVVRAWVDVRPKACRSGLGRVRERVKRLREDAGVLFEASEAVFVPRVVEAFSEKEQRRFNDRVLGSISGREARVSLVVFADAVRQDEFVVASRRDLVAFESDIPAPIRKFAMPFWRRKFVGRRNRFLVW